MKTLLVLLAVTISSWAYADKPFCNTELTNSNQTTFEQLYRDALSRTSNADVSHRMQPIIATAVSLAGLEDSDHELLAMLGAKIDSKDKAWRDQFAFAVVDGNVSAVSRLLQYRGINTEVVLENALTKARNPEILLLLKESLWELHRISNRTEPVSDGSTEDADITK